jgi:hypothetical protein
MNINELNWQDHPVSGSLARIFYPNGYGASILLGSLFYSNGDDTYEVGIIKGTPEDWELTYETPITDDVLGYLEETEVFETLKLIEELPDG